MTGAAVAKQVKAVEPSKRVSKAEQRRAVIDEYGKLIERLAPFRADLARATDLAKSIRDFASTKSPEQSCTLTGNRFVCHLGPCGVESRIADMETVFTSLGRDKFLQSCGMTIKALKEAGGNVAALTVKEPTGTRALSVTAKKKECL